MNRVTYIVVLLITGFCVSSSFGQLKFNYNQTGNPFADLAIRKAVDQWSMEFTDDITVNLNFGFGAMAGDILAGTGTSRQTQTYSDFWNAIGNDVGSGHDEDFFQALPTGSSFSMLINRTSEAGGRNHEIAYLDNDGGANNTNVLISTANAKALGLRGAHANGTDGAIVFNYGFQWDFDPTDGIDPGKHDFYAVALHEIGHALGFVSGVDELASFDVVSVGDGDPDFPDDNSMVYVNSLDFLRHSGDSQNEGADLDFTADPRDKYFSIDGGLTSPAGGGAHWATSVQYGDGYQASHWKISSGLGIMEPEYDPENPGGLISEFDLMAFDVIGYDRFSGGGAVPEPTGMAAGLLLLIPLMRRRRKSHLPAQNQVQP